MIKLNESFDDYVKSKNNRRKAFLYNPLYIYCVCKGKCDRKMEAVTSWNDISDLVIPIEFLKFVIAIMNRLRNSVFMLRLNSIV